MKISDGNTQPVTPHVLTNDELSVRLRDAIEKIGNEGKVEKKKERTAVDAWEFRPPGTNVQLLVAKGDDGTMWMWHINQWFQMKRPEVDGLPDKE